MITYENENARLLIERGEEDLSEILLSGYLEENINLYLSEKAALNLYNNYYKHELNSADIIVNGKPMVLIPMLKMNMI